MHDMNCWMPSRIPWGLVVGFVFLYQLLTAAPRVLSSDDISPELKAELLNPWHGDFQGMVERRAIRILAPYSKTTFFVDGAKKRGRVVERAAQLEIMLNRTRKKAVDEIQVLIVPTRRTQLISSLLAGLGDIAAGNLTVTEKRKKLVDFSGPVFRDVREIVVTHSSVDTLNSADDLSGQKIPVQEGSSPLESLEELNQRLTASGKVPVQIEVIDDVVDSGGILEMVNAGIFPAMVVDEHIAELWAQILPNIVLQRHVTLREKADIAWAYRKNSPELAAVLNHFVKQHGAGTGFEAILTKRYLKNRKFISDPTASAEYKRYQRLVPLIEKYSDKYQLDPLLVAAQGYQESRLRQEARSPVGAIGVMQIMPETGKELRVGDITQLEPNIHGGAKYMRRIIDWKFSAEEISSLDRILFALASYNAGPNRVARLRGETAAHGYNPNLWFNNVERVVAKKVGREPVRYVRNIYRYYLSYQIAEQHANRAKPKQ